MKYLRLICFLFSLLICTSLLSFRPVLAEETLEKPVIIIDPGHGGIDGGTNVGIRTEKVYDLLISQYLKEELLNHGGFEVYLTREDDTYLKYLPRALYIVTYQGDLLLSMHCNSSSYTSVGGAEAITSLISPYSAYTLGDSILAKISEKTGIINRGVRTRTDTGDSLGVYFWDTEKNWDVPGASHLQIISDYYSMNTWASKFGAPSLIIEHGYLSNSGDRALLDQDETLRAIAKAEAEALIEYYYGHTHTYTEEKVVDFPSSCSLDGTTSYHCTVCGIKKDTEPLPSSPESHLYRQSASAKATCTADGYIEYVCQISFNLNDKGYTTPVHTYREVLPMIGHAYEVVSDTSAGHGTNGEHTEVCRNCGDTITTVSEGDPHHYTIVEDIPADCTTDGRITYVCGDCGASYTEEIPAAGHQSIGTGICAVCGLNLMPETEGPETEALETEAIETETADTESIETDASETEAAETEMVPSEATETDASETETADTDAEGDDGTASVRKSPLELFRNPFFIGAMGIVAAQGVLFLLLTLRNRRKAHNSSRKTNTDSTQQ